MLSLLFLVVFSFFVVFGVFWVFVFIPSSVEEESFYKYTYPQQTPY